MSYLYKKFVNERVIGQINKTERIRNCTVIAHIDHGKTTLVDSLISSSGLLSKDVAAKARLLDYDLIEQERGITIKASGISLIHEYKEESNLIHLIDTPGHIDFSSHVTRGLRLTDGAIIVIDAIEGLMVQTETVTRQAMYELVRPVLFVNKIDRLINERKLDAMKVATEINKTVREFNAMLGKYIDDLLEEWEVSFLKGSLSVGSALHKWGIGIDTLLERAGGSTDAADLSQAFMDIIEEIVESYQNEEQSDLSEKYPLAKVVLDSVIGTVPNPASAQQYRVPVFWDGDKESQIGKNLLSCSTEEPCYVLVGDVQPDRHANTVAAVRIFSGLLKRAAPLKNLRTGETGKSLQIGLFMSKSRVALDEVSAGNLAFITGFKDIVIGDSLVDASSEDVVPMKGLQYPTEPVVTYTVEPTKLSELSNVQEIVSEYVKTDPSLEFEANPETGEMLLSGAGELHVEISIEKLSRFGIRVKLGKPMVLLREQMTTDGELCTAGEEPSSVFEVKAQLLEEKMDISSLGKIIASDAQSQCYLVDGTNSMDPYDDKIEWVKEAFDIVIRHGPVQGERLRKTVFIIHKHALRLEAIEMSWIDITQPLLNAMRSSILSGTPQILEPWLRLELSTPDDHVGTLTTILAKRRGHVIEIDSERSQYRIIAEIPVRESFGLANEIRTSTSGWATWGAKPAEYRKTRF
ncbi:MAG: GTP-binding protein [Candidatus Thorarchaeota archaeon]